MANEPVVARLLLRRSAVLLAARLLGMELVFMVSMLLIVGVGPAVFAQPAPAGNVVLLGLGFLLLLLILLLKLTFVVMAVLKWVNEYYELTPERITKHGGTILGDKDSSIATQDIVDIQLHQDFWGKLFRYGTLELQGKSKQSLQLRHIPNPHRQKDTVLRFIPALQERASETPADVETS